MSDDDDLCPICQQEYTKRYRLSPGTRWRDLYNGSPHDYFTNYPRQCTANQDVESDRPVGRRECVIYLHGGGRVQA